MNKEDIIIEKLDQVITILTKPVKIKKKIEKPSNDKYLPLLVIKLTYPSAMNFVSNATIFKTIGFHLRAKSRAAVSKILIKNGFMPGKVTVNNVQQRGFYLKFVTPMPTVEEIRGIME